jgi:hypothetical protein
MRLPERNSLVSETYSTVRNSSITVIIEISPAFSPGFCCPIIQSNLASMSILTRQFDISLPWSLIPTLQDLKSRSHSHKSISGFDKNLLLTQTVSRATPKGHVLPRAWTNVIPPFWIKSLNIVAKDGRIPVKCILTPLNN